MLAVLELVRLGRIRTQQTELFGDIIIERREDAPGDNGRLTQDSEMDSVDHSLDSDRANA